METSTIIINVLIFLLIIFWFIIRNLLIKNEKLEQILINKTENEIKLENYILEVKELVDISENKIKEIDHLGHFRADDEIGWFFDQIKEISSILSQQFLSIQILKNEPK